MSRDDPDRFALDNSARARRFIQTTADLLGGDFTDKRILDLGSAHGFYSLEMARRGAVVVGIEGRQNWLDRANLSKRDGSFDRATFIHGDVRHIDPSQLGTFDAVLCLGLLYHLGAADAVELLKTCHALADRFVLIDTQIAREEAETCDVGGETYSGRFYREHPEGATDAQREATLGASLREDFSFWFTQPSLLNALRDAGFTSVFEVKNPIDNLRAHGVFKLHSDVVTLVAMKGTPVGGFLGANPDRPDEDRWPERPQDHWISRPWH